MLLKLNLVFVFKQLSYDYEKNHQFIRQTLNGCILNSVLQTVKLNNNACN